MSTTPVQAEGGARCWTGIVASWHSDLVTYYANTGCEGVGAEAVTVTVESQDGHRRSGSCQDDQQVVLPCSAREIEGTWRCRDRCDQAVLTVTHRVQLPAGTQVPNLEPTSCALEGTDLSCSYPLTSDTLAVQNAWSVNGEDYLCVTRAAGEQRLALDALGETDADHALVATPAGTGAVEATPEAIRALLLATGGFPDIPEDDHAGQCDHHEADA